MKLYRIVKKFDRKYSHPQWTNEGEYSLLWPCKAPIGAHSRWSKENSVIYSSELAPTALLEALQYYTAIDIMAESCLIIEIILPPEISNSIEIISSPEAISSNWDAFFDLPAPDTLSESFDEFSRYPPETSAFGDRWAFERRSALLKVPSVISHAGNNVLINPCHDLLKQNHHLISFNMHPIKNFAKKLS